VLQLILLLMRAFHYYSVQTGVSGIDGVLLMHVMHSRCLFFLWDEARGLAVALQWSNEAPQGASWQRTQADIQQLLSYLLVALYESA